MRLSLFIAFMLVSSMFIASCENVNSDEIIQEDKELNPHEVFEQYTSLYDYQGITERIDNLKNMKKLTAGYALESLNNDLDYFESTNELNLKQLNLCKEVKELSGQDPCGDKLNVWEQIHRKFTILSKETIEENQDTVKIKIKFKDYFDNVLFVNETSGEFTYVLKSVKGTWKVYDFINEEGKLISETSELEERKQRDLEAIQAHKKSVEQMEELVEEIKQTIEEYEEEAEQGIYSMNQDLNVDYLTYKVVKAETFTEMGSSVYNKETEGKFIKVYLEITNNAKETKEIFSSRFFIIDHQDRKFDRLSNDIFYISDYIKLGEQLQPGLPISGAIVFELPKNSENLKLLITGDWLSKTEIKVKLTDIVNIGRDTTKIREAQEMMDDVIGDAQQQYEDAMTDAQKQMDELMEQLT